jgi:hypothetical protein
MREMTVREANQNFSQLIAAAERGDPVPPVFATPATDADKK